jgi:hypothetical protein
MSRFAKNITNYPGRAESITASDEEVFTKSTIYVGTGGSVAVKDAVGNSVTFTNVPNGSTLPVLCTAVLSTGTVTATGFIRIYEV